MVRRTANHAVGPAAWAPWLPGQALGPVEAELLAQMPDADAQAWMARAGDEKAAGRWPLVAAANALALRAALARDRRRVSNDALAASRGLAVALRMLGEWDRAQALQRHALSCLKRRRSDWTLQLAVEAEWADTLYCACRYAQARRLHEHVLALREEQLGNDHPEVAAARLDLAGTLVAMGEIGRATSLLTRTVAVYRAHHGSSSPLTLWAESNLASTLWASGNFDGARSLLERVVAESRRVPVSFEEAIAYENNLAATLSQQGQLGQARQIMEGVVASRTARQGRWHPDTLGARVNLAWMLQALGESSAARALCEADLTASRDRLGRHHATTFAIENVLSRTLLALGEDEAVRDMALSGIASIRHAATSMRNFFDHHRFCMRVLARQAEAARASGEPVPAWVAPLLDEIPAASEALREALELRPIDERTAALSAYVEFHHEWARLCIACEPDRLPQSLAPLHGIEAWSGVLARLRRPAFATKSPIHRAFLKAEGDVHRHRLESASLAAVADADARTRLEARSRAEEARLLEHWRDLRTQLARDDPGLSALRSLPSLTAHDLAADLARDEILVVTFALADSRAMALVVKAQAASKIVDIHALPSVADVVRRHHAHTRSGLRGATLRDALWGTDTCEQTATATLDDVIAAIDAAFWQALAPWLQGVKRVRLVSGPEHHGVPFECAAPAGLRVLRSFGLPAHASLRNKSLPWPPLRAIDMVIDPAWTWSPIPFVATEAAVVQELVAAHADVRQITGRRFLRGHGCAERLVLCMHGGLAGTAATAHGVLVVDASAQRPLLLEPPTVAALSSSAAEVYASACVGAVVGRDQVGSALGLCSEWQRCGVAAVVACLGPVPDFFMPLLGAMYWHSRLRGELPYQSLDRAKGCLRSGDWSVDVIEPLRRHYRTTMLRVLRRARCQGEPAADARRVASGIAGWLLPAYVRHGYFGDASFGPQQHRAFSEAFCDRARSREGLIAAALAYLIDERARPLDLAVRGFADAAIDAVCAYTHCFGRDVQATSTRQH